MYNNLMVSLVIPCYNEEQGIRFLLNNVPELIDEVIVVDNNSTDQTAQVAAEQGARVISEKQQGYGAACQRGFQEAAGQIICTLDGDGMYPLQVIPDLVEILEKEKLDFISVGRRPNKRRNFLSGLRYLGVLVLNLFIYFLFGIKLGDSQSGMWIFRKQILGKLRLSNYRWAFSQLIKIEAFSHREIKAREIFRPYYDQRIGRSKLNVFGDGFANLAFLFEKKFCKK